MSKYHDDTTHATHPGSVAISMEKLRALEHALFEQRTHKCNPLCDVDHPTHELRERYEEHLQIGASEPAVVVSTDPLVVVTMAGGG